MAYEKHSYLKGVAKGAAAFGVGFVAQTALKAATGARLSGTGRNPVEMFNPMSGGAGNLTGLAIGLVSAGVSGHAKSHTTRMAAKLVGYSVLAVLGAMESTYTIDPPDQTPTFVPSTQVPAVTSEYRNWIPGYAPQVTFPVIRPTSPTDVVEDVYTQVPRYANLF